MLALDRLHPSDSSHNHSDSSQQRELNEVAARGGENTKPDKYDSDEPVSTEYYRLDIHAGHPGD
ncbi:hypothetical protein C8039_10695 [Halogeometricum sp. wsp3]|nr:hypothetical protein C8039_10695 [Halogeometricum sp. wsp3]